METVYCDVVDRPINEAPVPEYSGEEHGTWELLLGKQLTLCPDRACDEFLFGVDSIRFPRKEIPLLRNVSHRIRAHTGWELLRVDGLVHPRDFFGLLSRKIFPSTDFIRKRSELDYTPAPDMFHDLFGHAPLLTNPDFTEFFEAFGVIGVNALNRYPEDHPIHKQLATIYWYSVEFGLIQTPKGVRAYGSGSVSSPEEIQFCVTDKCRKKPFDAEIVANTPYDIWHLQEDVFVIPSFAFLGQNFREFARSKGLLS